MDFYGLSDIDQARQSEGGTAKLNGKTVMIEYVFKGRGNNNDKIRAKVHTDTGVRYVDYCDLQVWGR